MNEKLEVNGNMKINNTLLSDGIMHLSGGGLLYLLNKDGVIIGKEWGGNGNLTVEGISTFADSTSFQKDIFLHGENPVGSTRDINFQFASAGTALIRSFRGENWDTYLQFFTSPYEANSPQVRMQIDRNGNVGIGCDNPSAKLHVNNGADSDASILATSSENNKLVVSSGSTQPAYCSTFKITQDYNGDRRNGYMSFNRGESTDGGFLILGTNGQDRVTIDTYGNVGIGKTNPTEKLEVNGKIRTSEVLITLDNWKDCVFYDNYNLMPLPELEVYINQNKHLPDVLSEKEILETGLPAGEMSKMQMQKIEELTLYIIQLNKIVQKQQEEIEKLKAGK